MGDDVIQMGPIDDGGDGYQGPPYRDDQGCRLVRRSTAFVTAFASAVTAGVIGWYLHSVADRSNRAGTGSSVTRLGTVKDLDVFGGKVEVDFSVAVSPDGSMKTSAILTKRHPTTGSRPIGAGAETITDLLTREVVLPSATGEEDECSQNPLSRFTDVGIEERFSSPGVARAGHVYVARVGVTEGAWDADAAVSAITGCPAMRKVEIQFKVVRDPKGGLALELPPLTGGALE